ncbi:MAG: hypothetical protein KC410_19010 [Anaerolineales bacterium]|uniref:hypothetical protein n=1 Tax=Promineifilum sp. TaxID=2664178 RepID=UPI001DFFA4C0|nr:hypothetical protein [Anaerolineales bacterium]MCB8936692.1 hypothetical protein [Promineifilum sp.]MCO5181080.1 hypothetical protein [Promineifilum sp.]
MEGNWTLTWLIVAYFGGLITSIVWPYLLAWIQNQEPFDWRMNAGRVLVGIMGALPLLASSDFLAQLGTLTYVAAFVLGMGASQLGRTAQKTVSAVAGA